MAKQPPSPPKTNHPGSDVNKTAKMMSDFPSAKQSERIAFENDHVAFTEALEGILKELDIATKSGQYGMNHDIPVALKFYNKTILDILIEKGYKLSATSDEFYSSGFMMKTDTITRTYLITWGPLDVKDLNDHNLTKKTKV